MPGTDPSATPIRRGIFDRLPYAWRAVVPVLLLAAGAAQAQLSPGELHRSHAFLEGVENCGKCHSSDRSNLSKQCLVCHTAVSQRVSAGKGLHASPDYRDCEMCHVEHHGRDFALIYFEDGERSFDHSLTGYQLTGRHARLDCRQCHIRRFIQNPDQLSGQSVNLDRTFLGLDTECSSCHVDQHRGQLSGSCRDCHSTDTWKPAAGFDHAGARFVLTGRHATVACDKCHPTTDAGAAESASAFVRFRPVSHQNCTDCHKDTHKGRLGSDCERCHSTAGWRRVQTDSFDHDRTRYPLRGRHASVDCVKCHSNDASSRQLGFAKCMDCHRDYHGGVFAGRTQAGACEECHTVEGFQPALFTLDQHDKSDYPLHGAHRAVRCNACHGRQASSSRPVFQFASVRCASCHQDPHRGQVDRWMGTDGCEGCHVTDAWAVSIFNHDRTNFALTGRHAGVACSRCHSNQSNSSPAVTFAAAKTACVDCHHNEHGEQFDKFSTDGKVACERCHTTAGWQPSTFDHAKDSRFVLDGAHIRVACSSCHKEESTADGSLTFVRYNPIDTACASCHANSLPTGKADL